MKRAVLIMALAGTLAACTPVINQRGYLADPAVENAIKIGTDTKTTVQQQLGDPSTTATFGNDAWYYISSIDKQIAFFKPIVEKRTILAVYFDKNGKVTGIKHFGLKDGHVVAFETRTTPTRGRELTFLQQLLNITPGTPIGQQEKNPGAGPGGGNSPY